MSDANIILLLNLLAYLILFVFYQIRKKTFDIGSILLMVWTIGSAGAIWYYSFPYVPKFYPNITVAPLVYLFLVNLFLIYPFQKCNYKDIRIVEVYNLRGTLKLASIFFGIIVIPPLLCLLVKMASFNFASGALAEMYGADADKATLLFPSFIKPFYSIIRHFTQFIIFLFFYNLGLKRGSKLIILGMGMNILLFFLVALMSASRGGIFTLMLSCGFFYFFTRHTLGIKVRKITKYVILCTFGIIIFGVAVISFSRFNSMNGRGENKEIDLWIAQYAGEGMLRFDDIAWHLDKHMGGYQTLPVVAAIFDEKAKNLDSMILKYDRELGTQIWMFDTYLGDIVIDFGKVGGAIAVFILGLIIRYLLKHRYGKMSMFKLIILNYFFILLAVGITADVYRTYYTQIEIVYVFALLGILYVLNSFIPNYAKFRIGNNNTCI